MPVHNDTNVTMKEKVAVPVDHRVDVAARRRAKMRLSLVRAGFVVMARKGVAATSIDDIVSEADVARGSFYKYFPGVPDLAQAVGIAVAEDMMLGLTAATTAIPDPAERLATGVRTILAIVQRNPTLGRFIVRAGWPVGDLGASALMAVGSSIEQGISQGRFRPISVPLAMALIGGVSIGCIHEIAEGRGDETIAGAAAETVLRGLGVKHDDARTLVSRPLDPLAWEPGSVLESV